MVGRLVSWRAFELDSWCLHNDAIQLSLNMIKVVPLRLATDHLKKKNLSSRPSSAKVCVLVSSEPAFPSDIDVAEKKDARQIFAIACGRLTVATAGRRVSSALRLRMA